MRLKWRFVPLFLLLLAIVEIVIFVLVAQAIGTGWAFLLLIAFSAAGMLLLAREGKRGWRRMREATRGGGPVGNQAADGIAGAAGALLLFLPGFLTGVVGALVLIPPIRSLAARRIRTSTEKRVSSSTAGTLFGPRFVRATRAPGSAPPPPPGFPPPSSPSRPSQSSPTRPDAKDDVIEGEIVD